MIYRSLLTLKPAMLAVGVLLILLHAVALFRGKETRAWLKAFPRNREIGVVLALAAGAWFFFLVKLMDLGDFDGWRRVVLIGTPIATLLAIVFIPDFLAVRSLGMLVLLVAEPLLESAFLREEQVRLLLVGLVYVWIVAGMFWVGMPFTLRDQIGWVSSSEKRWRAAAFAGLAYGALLCAGSLLVR